MTDPSDTLRPEERRERIEEVGDWKIRVTSYRLGDVWHATVDNVDPGAVIARVSAKSRGEAESTAVRRAGQRVAGTKIHG